MVAKILSLSPSVTERDVHQAMQRVVDDLVADGEAFPAGGADPEMGRQLATAAALFADLSQQLGIAPPAWVRDALG